MSNLEEILQMTDDLTDEEFDDLVAVLMLVKMRNTETGRKTDAEEMYRAYIANKNN